MSHLLIFHLFFYFFIDYFIAPLYPTRDTYSESYHKKETISFQPYSIFIPSNLSKLLQLEAIMKLNTGKTLYHCSYSL